MLCSVWTCRIVLEHVVTVYLSLYTALNSVANPAIFFGSGSCLDILFLFLRKPNLYAIFLPHLKIYVVTLKIKDKNVILPKRYKSIKSTKVQYLWNTPVKSPHPRVLSLTHQNTSLIRFGSDKEKTRYTTFLQTENNAVEPHSVDKVQIPF